MAKKKKVAPAGNTKPRQFRLGEDVMGDLDAVKEGHGLSSRAEAIRFLARREAKKIREKTSG